MSLLLDAAFLRDRLRLAALSTQDAPAENVIQLDLHARQDLHAPTSGSPATPRLPQPLAALGHGLGPPAAAPPAHAVVADSLVHDNSPPAALELLLRQAESDGNRQRRRSKVVSINTVPQVNAVALSPPPLPVPNAAAVASMIKPPDRRASLYVREWGNGKLLPATETATVTTAEQPAGNAPGANAVTPANQLSAALVPAPPADLDAQSLPPADSPPRHPLPPPTLVARSLAFTMSVDPDDDIAEVYGYDDVVAADNDDDDEDDEDRSDGGKYGSGVGAVSDTGADPGNAMSADRTSQIEQRRGPRPGPGENASVEVHVEGDGARDPVAPSVPDPVSLGDPASFDAILAQMEALARAQAMAPPDIFIRKPVAPKSAVTAQQSQLSAVLNAQSPQANPFAATYARYDGQHAKESMNLRVLIPFARASPTSDASANADAASTKAAPAAPAPAPSYAQRRRRGPPPPAAPPPGIPLDVHVCRSATVEQVIGYVLYLYVARGFEPTLDHPYHNDVHHWALRIVEEDGSVDEDFPALDRSRPMDGFQFDAFALCPTGPTPPDVPESAKAETITPLPTLRRPDPAPTAPVLSSAAAGLTGDASAAAPPTAPVPTTSRPTTKLFIKVHLYSTIEVRHTTTLNVAPTTPLAQIFDAVCRKRSVNPKDYLLKLPDMQTAITDLNQPFASLGNVTELFLMKKSIGTSVF
ncbi:hypothetical protein AMAG_12735 [Allomyces macrogynus ATCC 38327]|uniref:Uncharacterized protein n=1 Tax=Allomyces macrogynus (strain ATCC 38327) TaxID=578462 RepID=A0A0L0T1R3_ALLM3|nr:hypothetical protein AMAG_12735 [Allomyces macrogynus ATCC 38327]|eukprot:KNE68565.1 hypothetical protein AMAG_12735 [Allomyces macrogynus ATCC 38327]